MTLTLKQEHIVTAESERPFHFIYLDCFVDCSGLSVYEVCHTSATRPHGEYKEENCKRYPTLKQAKARYYYERRRANGLT